MERGPWNMVHVPFVSVCLCGSLPISIPLKFGPNDYFSTCNFNVLSVLSVAKSRRSTSITADAGRKARLAGNLELRHGYADGAAGQSCR